MWVGSPLVLLAGHDRSVQLFARGSIGLRGAIGRSVLVHSYLSSAEAKWGRRFPMVWWMRCGSSDHLRRRGGKWVRKALSLE